MLHLYFFLLNTFEHGGLSALTEAVSGAPNGASTHAAALVVKRG